MREITDAQSIAPRQYGVVIRGYRVSTSGVRVMFAKMLLDSFWTLIAAIMR